MRRFNKRRRGLEDPGIVDLDVSSQLSGSDNAPSLSLQLDRVEMNNFFSHLEVHAFP